VIASYHTLGSDSNPQDIRFGTKSLNHDRSGFSNYSMKNIRLNIADHIGYSAPLYTIIATKKGDDGPHLLHDFLLDQIPCADLTRPNIMSNNNILSILLYTLDTTPRSMHGWATFKIFQEHTLKRPNNQPEFAVTNYSALSSTYTDVDTARTIADSWTALGPAEIAEWEELAHDIRIAYAQLIATFGNRIVFEGFLWEEERLYHVRTIYLKWLGCQTAQARANTTNLMTAAFYP
ncbi:7339_t:CDS:2, partial [Acaulospora colombiana]